MQYIVYLHTIKYISYNLSKIDIQIRRQMYKSENIFTIALLHLYHYYERSISYHTYAYVHILITGFPCSPTWNDIHEYLETLLSPEHITIRARRSDYFPIHPNKEPLCMDTHLLFHQHTQTRNSYIWSH